MKNVKVVVTDFIEPELEWEAKEMARRGVEFQTHQLKFAPSSETWSAATRDADLVVVNMVPINHGGHFPVGKMPAGYPPRRGLRQR